MATATPTPGRSKRLAVLVSILAVLVCALIARDALLPRRAHPPLPRPEAELTIAKLAPPGAFAGTMFQRLSPKATGIDFVGRIVADHPQSYLYETGFTSGGIAIGDVDNDGRPDVYFTSGPDANRLYRQVDDFRFEDVAEEAGVGGDGAWSAGAAMADVDNDGRLDIYVCNYDSPNLLYINQGDGTFLEQARQFGLHLADACIMAAFCDYDLDGDLDVYMLGNRYVSPKGRPVESPVEYSSGRVRIRPEYEKYYQLTPDRIGYSRAARSDALFRNNGDGTFSNVAAESGLWGAFQGLSVTWWDYNEDGLPDIYVANDFDGPDQLYRNNGDGAFTDVLKLTAPHTPWFSMGADAADLNNDGRADFLVADMARTARLKRVTSMRPMHLKNGEGAGQPPQYMRNAMFINVGAGRFLETAQIAGMARTDWTWAVKLADFDNDGRVDAYFSNGFTRDFTDSDYPITPEMLVGHTTWDHAKRQSPLLDQDLAYRNLGDLRFRDVSREWGLADVGISMAAAYGDMDRDGDLDLIVYNADGPPLIYRNNSSSGHRMLVRLEGARSNRFGLGAKVRISTTASEQIRELSPMTGYLSSNEPLVHFGLGDAETVDELTVDWPSGHRQQFRDLPVNRLLTIVEPFGPPPRRKPPADAPTQFHRSDALAGAVHRERPFDDYALQPMLPHRLSQLGPGMAWSDVDDDGDQDFFLGGAAGEPGTLWINQSDGSFKSRATKCLFADRLCEDMGAVWFDADQDGDPDLYVVSGSVEFGDQPALLRDRLYLNDGAGKLHPAAPDALPALEESGGPAAAADFDRDGDLDLFVGGRVVPGRFPLPANGRLLRNQGGRFVDATDEAAPQLIDTGMVAGALWSDADGDGWIDLLVTHQWGPVKLFRNDAGRLVDATQKAGLAEHVGWWNGIAGRDVDGDGDMDYVATNLGRNTPYRASPERPVVAFYGDLDDSGVDVLLEAEFEDDRLVPVRGREELVDAMPGLIDRFDTFAAFGAASVEEIVDAKRLASARRFEVNFLDSAVLINLGAGRFHVKALPNLAQIAPGFGAAFNDYDADGCVDLYIAQNFFSTRPSMGRFDGGLSQLFRGDGRGGFAPASHATSGLIAPGDAKSLACVDFNGDGRQDFVVGLNSDRVVAFENRVNPVGPTLRVRLEGRAGNPHGIGSTVRATLNDGSSQTAEVYAGEGYLSQSPADIAFGLGEGRRAASVEVRWPTSETTVASPEPGASSIVIKQP